MRKQNNVNQKNFILTGSDGGMVFTLATAIPLVVSVIYSVILISSGLYGNEEFISSPLYSYLSFGLSSLSLFFVLIYLVKKHSLDFRQSIKLNGCDKKYFFLAIALSFCALFGLGWINDLFVNFLRSIGFTVTETVLPKNNALDYILCVIIVCVLPAFFEETIFRGLLLNGARRAGHTFAVICCGLLFSLFHKSPAQTIYQFILGATFTLLTLRSGSIIPAMLFHFINNFYVVTSYFLMPEGYSFDVAVQIVLCVLGVILFAVLLLYLLFKCKNPKKDLDLDADYNENLLDKKSEKKYFLIFAIPGIVACAIFWIIALF